MNNKDNFIKNKEAPTPDKKEEKDFKDLEGEILKQIVKSLDGNRKMEAYFLAWTTVEQFMLPRLMHFIVKKLNITLPKDFPGSQISHLIKNYYFLSHDKELYLALEKARKNRNNLTHEIYRKENWESIKKEYKRCLKEDIAPILELLRDRFNGKTKIPVLALYSKGWNDGLENIKNKLL